MGSKPLISAAGLVVGVLYGIFGVGSAFATPILALIGVAGMPAVVGPLPGLLPGSATGAWAYWRNGNVDVWVAKRTIAGAFPAAIVGSVTSRFIGGPALVALSGIVLLAVGLRVLRPVTSSKRPPWAHHHPTKLMFAAVVIGFASGLLANGGGFLLVPLFLLTVGLTMSTATGTSLVVATVLTIPTLVTHAIIGDINWTVAALFAVGLVPGARVGVAVSERVSAARLREGFGWLLVLFAAWFLVREGFQYRLNR